MRQRLFKFITFSLVAACLPALAGIKVTGPFIDETTGGDWRGTYGSCFYLVPDGHRELTKDAVGPDSYFLNREQYRYNNCFGGAIFSLDQAETNVDFRIFREDADASVTSWHTDLYEQSAAQWNPCLGDFRHATWSNKNAITDPLTVELRINAQGQIQLAYYLTNAANRCRESDVVLLVDGVEMASGTIGDIAGGKYVVFEVDNLKSSPIGTTFTFQARDAAGDPTCSDDPEEIVGFNTHISGVFVDFSGGKSCSKLGPPLLIGE